MAASMMHSVTADVVLQQLNQEFDRSKTEQISRFLRDQEELHKALSTYGGDESCDELEEDDDSDTETLLNQRLDLYRVRPTSAMGWHLQDFDDQASVTSAHLSDVDSDVENKRQIMCVGGKKPLNTLPDRGVMTRRGRDPSPVSQSPAQRESSMSRARSRSNNRGAVNRENSYMARDTQDVRDSSVVHDIDPPTRPHAASPPPALSRKGSLRQRIYKVSSGSTNPSGATSSIRRDLIVPRPPPRDPAMRPRTTTGIQRPQMADDLSKPVEPLRGQTKTGECPSVQRMRASAPANISREHRRIIFNTNSMDYLKIIKNKNANYGQTAGLDMEGCGKPMQDLTLQQSCNNTTLDDIHKKQRKPSYSSSTSPSKSQPLERSVITQLDNRTTDLRHNSISSKRLENWRTAEAIAPESCTPSKLRGVQGRGHKDQMAMLRLPPLEGCPARPGDPHLKPHNTALISRGGARVKSQAHEFAARS